MVGMVWEPPPPPPRDEHVLLERAYALSGLTLEDIARRYGQTPPPDLRRHKGWVGQLLEMALGARAGSRAEPDFPHLGVELKTLPVDPQGKPYESTFVCTAPAGGLASCWEESWLRRKLACVLWVPIVGRGPPGARIVGGAICWRPDVRETQLLRTDWEALRAILVGGRLDEISGRRGAVLQLRPKGANAADTSWVLDADANWVQEQQRAFYLRPRFTHELLTRALRTQ